MAVYVDSINFSNELATQDTSWLLGVVGERLVVTIDISIRETALPPDADSEFEFAPTVGYINPQQVIKAQSSVFANFQVGDIINITNAGGNNRTGATITEKISDSEIRTGETFTNALSTTATIIYATPITALNFFYGLIENSETFNTLSKLTNTNQKFFATGLNPSDLVTVTTMTADGSKAWQNGGATIVGLGTDTYNQKFRIVHTFDLLPYYNEDEDASFQSNTKPSYFLDTKCLKYVSQFDALEDISNPNKKQTGLLENTLGNTGEFNENFNNVPTIYSTSGFEITDNSSNLQDTIFITEDEQNIEFFVNASAASFSNNNTKFVLLFSALPTKGEYTVNTRTVKQNFIFDRKLQTVGSAAANGDNFGGNEQALYQITSTFISTTQIRINFKIKFSSAAVNYISGLESKKYLIGCIIQNHALATDVADKTTLLVNKGVMFKDLSDDGLITFANELIEHDDTTLLGSSAPQLFNGDEVIHRSIIIYNTLNRDTSLIRFDSIKCAIVAYKDESKQFELRSNEIDLSNEVYVNNIPQLNISTQINDPVFSDINRSNLIIKRRSDLDTTSAIGYTNLVVNGGFDSNILGWTQLSVVAPLFYWNSGKLKIDMSIPVTNRAIMQTISGMVTGEDYRLTFDVTSINLSNSSGMNVLFTGVNTPITGVGTYTVDVLNWDGASNLLFITVNGYTPSSIELDNFSIIDLNEVVSSEITGYAYEVSYPFINRWEYWEALDGVDSDFFNITQPNNGQNHLWYHYQALGYEAKARIELAVTNNEFQQTYRGETTLLLNDYNSNAAWINEYIKSFTLANVELTSGGDKFVQKTADTRIEAYFEKTSAFVSANISVVIWAESFEAGGVTGRYGISSLFDVEANTLFKSVDTSNKVKLTFVGNTVKAEALIDNDFLPQVEKMRVYARLYEKTTDVDSKATQAGDNFIFQNADNYLFQSQ